MRAWEARDPMTDLVVKLQEDIAAWQEASGLVNEHGDPDGIEPRHLSKHVASLTARVEEQSSRIEELEGALREIEGRMPEHPIPEWLAEAEDEVNRDAVRDIRQILSRALQRDATEGAQQGGRSDG